jgi:hypothetical protein
MVDRWRIQDQIENNVANNSQTSTSQNNNPDRSKPTQSWSEWVTIATTDAQAGVQREIAEHKAKGNPIYYQENGKSIMENSNGERFEYRETDKGIEIINKLQ